MVNPHGVSVRKRRLHRVLAEVAGFPNVVLLETERAGHAADYCRAHAGEFDKIISVGGDGLLMEVLNGAIDAPVAFGALPGGSACDFIKAAPGYPATLDELLASRRSTPIDVGRIRFAEGKPHYFFEEAGVGLDAATVDYIPAWLRRIHVKRAYDVGALRAIVCYRPFNARVWLDTRQHELRRVHLLAVCNAPYFGDGMPIAPDARLDDGQLHVFAIADTTRFEVLRNFGRVRQGTHIDHPRAIYQACRQVRIEADRPLSMCVDGDLLRRTPIQWDVLPGRARLIVPGRSEPSR